MQFDDIVKEIGGFGRYQIVLVMLVMFPQILISIQALLPVFILSNHDHWCQIQLEKDALKNNVTSYIEQNHFGDIKSYVTLNTSQCSVDVFINGTNNTQTDVCSSWTYDTRELTRSPISDFNLVCDDAVLTQHASMVFLGGNLFGSFMLGSVGDTWGRKIVMYIGAILLFGSSLANAWSVNYIMFVTLRFISGAATISCIGSAMIIVFESVDSDHRSHAAVAVELAWCLGEVILSGAAYFLRDWRQLQIAVSSPGVLLFLYWFLMPESARWFLSKGNGKEAMRIAQRAARVNGKTIEIDIRKVNLQHHQSKHEITPVFKSFRLLFRFTVVLILWFVLALSYYGLTFSVGRIGHNVYLDFIIYAVLEMVAYISCLFINTRFGRKPLNVGAFLLAGVACVASTMVSLYAGGDNGWLIITLSAIGRMGVSTVFANIFVYTSELFPTTIRSFILAVCNVFTRLGAVIAPYISAMSTDNELSNTSLTFGVLSLVAGVLSCFLPETLNTKLPDSMEDIQTVTENVDEHQTKTNQISGGTSSQHS
ncbi:organic cation transporter protein-like [Argopecten irradians]|uniref:organic cation transporter protein-like n=1 Tax=Argopecten irradians TaxID=31199 RepID=UPI0037109845